MYRALWHRENREIFYNTLDARHKTSSPVELIIGLEHPDRNIVRSALEANSVKPVRLEFFEFIPYAVITTTAYEASSLADIVSRRGFILSDKGVPLIGDVDVSHTVSIPDGLEQFTAAQRALFQHLRRMHLKPRSEPEEDDEQPTGSMWNLRNVEKYKAEQKWYMLGQSVKAAVIDTGCDYTHPEIRERFNPNLLGYNFSDNNTNPRDGHGHGTHVAGTVAGQRVGVAPYASLFAVKVLSDSGSGSDADVMRGIEWCIRNNIDVGNMSLGGSAYTEAFEKMCRAARERGLILVAAAGNQYVGKSYPAAFETVISVAAVDRERRHAEFSNVDESVDVSAPGVKVLSCVPGGGYKKYSGTSMASPHTAGAVAAGLSLKKPKRNATGIEDLEEILKDSCYKCQSTGSPFVDGWMYGAGHIDVNEFMSRTRDRL